MATLLQVLDGLGALASSAVYPDGIAYPSVAGVDVEIISGWPQKDKLENDLANGNAQVSIYPMSGMERNTTRYRRELREVSISASTIILTVYNDSVTISGSIAMQQACMVILNGTGYAYAVQEGDTLESIAENLALLIPGATAAGNTITMTGVNSLEARVTTKGISAMPIKSQEKVFCITVWAPNFIIRDILATAIEVKYSLTQRIQMPDKTFAALSYKGAFEDDYLQKGAIYRRDIRYAVDYTTIHSEENYTISYSYFNTI